eukprot:1618044-Amphidinium_carterae.1
MPSFEVIRGALEPMSKRHGVFFLIQDTSLVNMQVVKRLNFFLLKHGSCLFQKEVMWACFQKRRSWLHSRSLIQINGLRAVKRYWKTLLSLERAEFMGLTSGK